MMKINTRKGRAAVVIKPKDHFVNTPLSRLLAKAEILENQLIKSSENGISLKEFCEVNKMFLLSYATGCKGFGKSSPIESSTHFSLRLAVNM
jgi:hypothetical protein